MGSLKESRRRPGGNANCRGTVGCLDTVFFSAMWRRKGNHSCSEDSVEVWSGAGQHTQEWLGKDISSKVAKFFGNSAFQGGQAGHEEQQEGLLRLKEHHTCLYCSRPQLSIV